MSGSGGGGGNGGKTPDSILRCETISFNTDVNSPQPSAIAGLQVNDVLQVINQNNTAVVVRDTGAVVGSINWISLLKLIECLNTGYQYVAVVKDIQDGLIKVHISPQRGN